jgi:hypothetical protein
MPKRPAARSKTKIARAKTPSRKTQTVPPITKIAKAQEQHMLLLFLPINSKLVPPGGVTGFQNLLTGGDDGDLRPLTGVHFYMAYLMRAGDKSRIVVPTFQTAPAGPDGVPKDLLVVLSIYDADFGPYISAFLTDPAIVKGLNGVLTLLDESGIVPDSDPTSAKAILKNGGVAKNAQAFFALLMRYNFADPTVPAVGPGGIQNPPAKPWPYALAATFPGLTVGMFLKPKTGYPNAVDLWPAPGEAPKIYFEPSTPPK